MDNLHFIASYLHSFFYQYLAKQKGLSDNTILAYRDTVKLLLRFASKHFNQDADKLNVEDMDNKFICNFLDDLEKNRGCGINTRNARLAAIRTLFLYIGDQEPALLEQSRQIRNIPLKRTEYKPVTYLEDNELKTILNSIDLNSRTGLRDRALILFLYNTGARVQEAINVKLNDIRFEMPAEVTLLGKGKKQRVTPLWPDTIEAVNDYLKYRNAKGIQDEYLFLNANGKKITRFGVRDIIKRYAQKASLKCSSLSKKTVSTHTLRHTTAVHLIQSGNDINMVKLWLGHADINTTHMYVEISMELKRKILDTCDPPKSKKKYKWQKPSILTWLDNLSNGTELCEV